MWLSKDGPQRRQGAYHRVRATPSSHVPSPSGHAPDGEQDRWWANPGSGDLGNRDFGGLTVGGVGAARFVCSPIGGPDCRRVSWGCVMGQVQGSLAVEATWQVEFEACGLVDLWKGDGFLYVPRKYSI
ncbi:unnamed protein product [Calypogeia fissa]